MDRAIKELISKKLRKNGKDYNLTPNTKLSAQDFSYANKIASQIYRFSKATLPRGLDREVYQKLLTLVMKIVRADEVHELGQLRIGYGNTSCLKGFQLNPRQSWSGYIPWNTLIVCNLKGGHIEITIPETKRWLSKKYNERVSKLAIKYHLFKIPFQLEDEPATLSTKNLYIQPTEEYDEKKTRLDIGGWDNCLVIVVGTVQSYLWETQGNEDYLSMDKSFMGAQFLEVFCLRDDKLIHDRPKEKSHPKQMDEEDGAEWE